MFCTKCGKELTEGANFCSKCGNKVEPFEPVVNKPAETVQEIPFGEFHIPETVEEYAEQYSRAYVDVVTSDDPDAVKRGFRYLEFCAQAGDADAIGAICVLCGDNHKNDIIPTNVEYAMDKIEAFAAQGNVAAQYWMGLICQGDHDSYYAYVDKSKAAYWFEQASLSGNTKEALDAMIDLAVLYSRGDGVALNHGKEVQLLMQAAEAGSARAQVMMARRYQDGTVVRPDIMKAKAYLQQAMAGDDEKHSAMAAIMNGMILYQEGKNEAAKYFLNMGLGCEKIGAGLRQTAMSLLEDL